MDWSVNTIQFLALQVCASYTKLFKVCQNYLNTRQEVHGLFLDFFLTTSSALCLDQQQAVTAWEPPDPEEKCCVTIEVGIIII